MFTCRRLTGARHTLIVQHRKYFYVNIFRSCRLSYGLIDFATIHWIYSNKLFAYATETKQYKIFSEVFSVKIYHSRLLTLRTKYLELEKQIQILKRILMKIYRLGLPVWCSLGSNKMKKPMNALSAYFWENSLLFDVSITVLQRFYTFLRCNRDDLINGCLKISNSWTRMIEIYAILLTETNRTE